MAIILENYWSYADPTASSWNNTINIPSVANSLLVCWVAAYTSHYPTNVSVDSVNMTQLDYASNGEYISFYYMKNPPTGSKIWQTSWSYSYAAGAQGMVLLSGVNQTSPFGTVTKPTGTGSSYSMSVTSLANDFVLGAFAQQVSSSNSFTPTSGTQLTSGVSTNGIDGYNVRLTSLYTNAGGTSTTLSGTGSSNAYASLGVAIKPDSYPSGAQFRAYIIGL